MRKAFALRKNSDDPKVESVFDSGVGAVIVQGGSEIGSSANVLPPRLKSAYQRTNKQIDTTERYHIIEHAERAAIFSVYDTHKDLADATMYCTRFPCSDCARAIIWSGISRLVVPKGFSEEAFWRDRQKAALRMLRDAGVVVRYLPAK